MDWTATAVPDGWRRTYLGELISLQRGFDLPARLRRSGHYPVLSSGGLAGTHDEGPVKGPGLVIGRATNLGKPTWSAGDYWPLNTTLFVKDFRGNDPRFVYYLLTGLDLSGYDSGSVQPMLNRNYIAGVALDVPLGIEQLGIAATLGALDDKIESNRRAIDLTMACLDSLAVKTGEALPRVPLVELVDVHRESVDPGSLAGPEVDHFSLPAFDAHRLPDRVSPDLIKSNKLAITAPSVLVSRLNPRTNRTWFAVPEPGIPALASTEFLVLIPRPPLSLGSLWVALRSRYFRSELARRATGTSGSHQRLRPADALSVSVPDVRSLARGDTEAADGLLLVTHQRQIESQRLAALRDALLPELLSGRIRVPEAREAVEAAATSDSPADS